jgi:cysteine synthase
MPPLTWQCAAVSILHQKYALQCNDSRVCPNFAPRRHHVPGSLNQFKTQHLADSQFKGLQYINGYDDPAIIAGAGTIGLEILEQIPDVEAVIVPVGGAGLIAGIALAIKSVRPEVHVIGVEPERS